MYFSTTRAMLEEIGKHYDATEADAEPPLWEYVEGVNEYLVKVMLSSAVFLMSATRVCDACMRCTCM